MIKVKCLHLQAEKFPQELPGVVVLIKSCAGVEALVVDFKNMYNTRGLLDMSKHLRHLKCTGTAALKDNAIL